MTEKPQNTPMLTLTGVHRISSLGNEATPGHMYDCVTMMCKRAESVLLILSGQFEGDDNAKWSDSITWHALESAILEIKDIEEVVASYYAASSKLSV